MTNTKAIFRLLLAAVAAGAYAGASSAENTRSSSGSRELHLTKECGEYKGQAGHFCTIMSSNVEAIPVGSRIFYLQAAEPASLDSDIVLVVGPGNYALGHVTLDFALGTGEVRFAGGTGRFTSFRATAGVSALGGTNWAWDGEYRLGRED
jgi:hypothetical protein